MLFRDFAAHLQKIEHISARLEITARLVDLYQELLSSAQAKQELVIGSYLLQGSLAPSYQSLEFQISEKMLVRALAAFVHPITAKLSPSSVDLFAELQEEKVIDAETVIKTNLLQRYKQVGDIGELFFSVMSEYEGSKPLTNDLTVVEVHQQLREIALTSGVGSQDKKVELLRQLLLQVDPTAAKYLSRIILSKLRLGFSTMTLLDALSFVKQGSKVDSELLERIFGKKADLGKLALAYLLENRAVTTTELLQSYDAELGVPIQPVLCQRLNSAVEIIEKMGEVIAEPKYDGLRVQIHFRRKEVFENQLHYKVFTRNLDDVTHMFPELVDLDQYIVADECILDAEAIGIDRVTGKFLAFQETIQRKRKHDVASKAAEVPICFFVFDLLWLNGVSLLDQALSIRKNELATVITSTTFLQLAPHQRISDPVVLREFHERQLSLGLEGAVMKQPSSAYVAGRKSWRWVKIKEEEGSRGKLSDTIDCVMMGYYLGKGKRQQFGIGALLVGVLARDQENNLAVKSLSKIGTGLTDEQFQEIKALADACRTPNNQQPVMYEVDKTLFPDVWLQPQLILEVAADEISKSPIHTAGVALRFPRLIGIRSDKKLDEATTLAELSTITIA